VTKIWKQEDDLNIRRTKGESAGFGVDSRKCECLEYVCSLREKYWEKVLLTYSVDTSRALCVGTNQ
jgi:hypothetical protein